MLKSLLFLALLTLIEPFSYACPNHLRRNLNITSTERFELIPGKETKYAVKVGIERSPSKIFEAAVRTGAALFADMWKSNATISIAVSFEGSYVTGNETLGHCYPGSFVSIGDHLWVPVAFAKKVETTKVITWNSVDIFITINRDKKWFLDVEGDCPKNHHDFMSTFLHELYHGTLIYDEPPLVIGKNATFRGGKGRYSSFLAVGTSGGDCGIWSYFKHPELLKLAITSNNVWFVTSQGRIVPIHAPAEYVPGVSLYHRRPTKMKRFMEPFSFLGVKNRKRDEIFLRMEQALLNMTESGATFCDAFLSKFAPIQRPDSNGESKTWVHVVIIVGTALCAILSVGIAVVLIRTFRRRAEEQPSDREPSEASAQQREVIPNLSTLLLYVQRNVDKFRQSADDHKIKYL